MLNLSKHVREKCGKTAKYQYSQFQKGLTPTKMNGNLRHSYSIGSTVKRSHMQNCSSICQRMKEKNAATVYFQYSKFQKGHNSNKN